MARNITAAQLDGEIRAILAYPRREKPDVEHWLNGWLRDNPDVSRGPGGRYVAQYAKAIRERHHATKKTSASQPQSRTHGQIDNTLRNLQKLDAALSTAQGVASSVVADADDSHASARALGDDTWNALEALRRKIYRMIERRERRGGVF